MAWQSTNQCSSFWFAPTQFTHMNSTDFWRTGTPTNFINSKPGGQFVEMVKHPRLRIGNTKLFTKSNPRNLTWNLKISPWKRKVLLETIIFRFHVKFRGCILLIITWSGFRWLRTGNHKQLPLLGFVIPPTNGPFSVAPWMRQRQAQWKPSQKVWVVGITEMC